MSEPEITEDDVARYWDANAGPWADEVRQGHDVAREWLNNPAFLAFVGDLRGRDVLDAGCGEGYNTRLLARAGARMTGVDLSERMIELAAAEERRAPQGIRYLRTSYAALGMLAAASFDAVVSFMALMDGPHLGEALREAFRVLRPGGLLAFSITHPCFITKGSHWNYNEAGEKVSWVVSEYFNPARWIDGWRFTDAPAEAPRFAVPRFDRTLSEYVNTLIETGFVLRRIESRGPRRPTARPIRASAAGATTPVSSSLPRGEAARHHMTREASR